METAESATTIAFTRPRGQCATVYTVTTIPQIADALYLAKHGDLLVDPNGRLSTKTAVVRIAYDKPWAIGIGAVCEHGRVPVAVTSEIEDPVEFYRPAFNLIGGVKIVEMNASRHREILVAAGITPEPTNSLSTRYYWDDELEKYVDTQSTS